MSTDITTTDRPFHTSSGDEVVDQLEVVASSGLDQEEARRRLEQTGRNELVERDGIRPWRIFLSQFTDTMVIVLMVAAVIAAAIGDTNDAIVILVIVVLNAVLGFVQEYRAERAIQALKLMAVPNVRVRRNGGNVLDVPAVEIVPGDIVLLEAGSAVPADGRLLEAVSLQVAEAALTGEAYPTEKTTSALRDPNLNVGDRHNMVYMGTVVSYGHGEMVVAQTAMKTQLGHVAGMIQSVEVLKPSLEEIYLKLVVDEDEAE